MKIRIDDRRRTLTALALTLTLLLAACSAGQVDQALSDIDLAVQTASVICTVLGAVAPADAIACQMVAGVATTGLGIIKTDYDAWVASGAVGDLAKLQTAITELQANLPAELAAAHVSSPAAVATITAWVSLITSSLTAVLTVIGEIKAATPATARLRAAALGAALPTAASLHIRWTTEVCKGDTACGGLVKVHNVHYHHKLF
jgi:hypothetical protein